jgi:hypothetical protein
MWNTLFATNLWLLTTTLPLAVRAELASTRTKHFDDLRAGDPTCRELGS